MIRRTAPRVHDRWTAAWFDGRPALAELFGAPPTLDHLRERAGRLADRTGWETLVHRASEQAVPAGALVVLAGQQPVLGGGPGLLAHKAATAVALSRELEPRLERPVVPLFLLATQDHDSDEVDHLDLIDESNGHLDRIRCPIEPKHEMFSRSRWKKGPLTSFFDHLGSGNGELESLLQAMAQEERVTELPWHVAELLHAVFGPHGLRIVEAHRLAPRGREIVARALGDPASAREALAAGARAVEAEGLAVSFDPRDPRPLVLESSGGRRRRLGPRDRQADQRFESRPEDFSPHAALRPVTQAAALPVVAQVAGPSEMLYLAQARGLHEVFGEVPPVLVPRLEATRVPPDLWELAEDPPALEGEAQRAAARLAEAGRGFRETLVGIDPGLASRLDRFVERLEREAGRLAEEPAWRGHGDRSRAAILHPRGRPQDTILAWVPDAWSWGRPTEWAAHVVGLARPLEPPTHVLHTLPEPSDG